MGLSLADIRPMDLTHADKGGGINAHPRRERAPAVCLRRGGVFQLERASAEAVRRDRVQRPALQPLPPRLLHPLEVAARLW